MGEFCKRNSGVRQLPFKAKKFFFKEILEKSISKNTFHAVVFYVAFTNIINIYGVEK